MRTKHFTIQSAASTGNQSYSGVGFQGKLLIVTYSTSDDDASTAMWMMGAATSSTNRVCATGRSNNNQATSTSGARRTNARVLEVINASSTVLEGADFVSWDSDGFTLNWNVLDGSTRTYRVTVIGGDDVQAVVGSSQAGASTGNQSVTGLSFQPNTLILFDSILSSSVGIPGNSSFWRPQIGFVDTAGNVGSWAGDTWDAQAAAVTNSIQSTSACVIATATSGGAIDRRATFVSYNSDGFTLNWTTLDATVGVSSRYLYIALNVPFSNVGSTDQRTSTGTTQVTVGDYLPRFLMLGGDASTRTNSGAQGHRFGVGIAIGAGSNDQVAHAHHDTDAADPTNTSRVQTPAKVLRWITANGATPTTLIQASISAIAKGSFTINYDTVDATARKVIYLAMGDAGRVPRHGFINHQNPGIL